MLMSSNDRPAVLRYEQNGFRVLSAGNFVLCAVTGERVTLEALRYWNEERQEAYATPEAATRRLMGQG
jgi:hypothetical protein